MKRVKKDILVRMLQHWDPYGLPFEDELLPESQAEFDTIVEEALRLK